MKFIHLADLHIGKRLHEYPLIEDQKFVLDEILAVCDAEEPDGVIIAGDVYDKTQPSAEAVRLFDDFLSGLARRKIRVFVISGNHDSPERIAFGSRIMDADGIHMSPVYDGRIVPVTLRDEFGPVNVYMLPFVKPSHVRQFREDDGISSYTDAMECVISDMAPDTSVRNVLITHQFITGSRRSDSENFPVGTLDNVDVRVFAPFDYVALGHLHSPQSCGAEHVRYSGSPLKYSFSEAGTDKSVTVAELFEKGNVSVRTIPLRPLRDTVELRGSYDELMSRSFYEGSSLREDFVRVTLTDETEIPSAFNRLRTVYRRLLRLDYDNLRTSGDGTVSSVGDVRKRSPEELVAGLFEIQNNRPMDGKQKDYLKKTIGEVWGEEG